MDTKTRTEYDAITGVTKVIALTEAEILELEKEAKEEAEKNAQAEAAKSAAQAKLEALGITADDLKALGL
jgi:antitoxin component HigA of HigAB toxin-antitoxin module